MSWSRVRSDSVVGMVGTISASAAPNTLSLVSVIPGGQSRSATSYRSAIGSRSAARRRVGCFVSSRARSRWRSEKSAGTMCTAGSSVARMFAASDPDFLTRRSGAAFDDGFDPDEERCRPLRVEVPQQHP